MPTQQRWEGDPESVHDGYVHSTDAYINEEILPVEAHAGVHRAALEFVFVWALRPVAGRGALGDSVGLLCKR